MPFYIIIFSFFTWNLIAQNNISYKITYETIIQKPQDEHNKRKSKNLNKQEKDAKKYSDIIISKLYDISSISELTINDSLSTYITKNGLDENEVKTKIRNFFNSITKNKGLYYFNNKTKEEIISKNAFGQDFLITSYRDSINWVITKEVKTIGKFICYRANAKIKVKNIRKDNLVRNVSVWFTPLIPVNLGPINYSGLPGLILEVNVFSGYGSIITKATEINLEFKKTAISKPNKGKIVTHEEFEEIGRKIYMNKFNTD